jgi:hypothetical protein
MNSNKLYKKSINDIAKLMSVESKVNMVGSASIKKNIYYGDYDLFEKVEGPSKSSVYAHFKSLFYHVRQLPKIVITDFKIGDKRWSYDDIMNKENDGMGFDDALNIKGIIKLDIIALINNRFYEITEVYQMCFNGKCNMEYKKDVIIKDLVDEYKLKTNEGNYMKALKKMYSIIKIKNNNDPKLNVLLEYFNSAIGLLYRNKSELETILIVIDNDKFTLDDVRSTLEEIKEQVSAFPVPNYLEEIIKKKTKKEMTKLIRKQVFDILGFLNRDAKKFIQEKRL